jgi:hypothetical protein
LLKFLGREVEGCHGCASIKRFNTGLSCVRIGVELQMPQVSEEKFRLSFNIGGSKEGRRGAPEATAETPQPSLG